MEILLWPWIAYLYYVHQFWLVEGNDLNHLLESNQVGLFRACSIVFERLIRPYTLPPHKKTCLHTKYKGSSPCGFKQEGFFSYFP